MTSRSERPNVMPGTIDRRAGLLPGGVAFLAGKVPPHFPTVMWTRQSQFYADYMSWYTGEYLAEETADSDPKDPTYKYPLGVNSIADFSRKLANVLMGEAPDGPDPLVKTSVRPKMPLNGEPPSDADRLKAKIMEGAVNEVWSSSGGRALQSENAIVTQYMGGCVYQVAFMPELAESRLFPIQIKTHPPDCVLPIWAHDDPFRLLECFVIYRIDNITAHLQYNQEPGPEQHHGPGFQIYVEHWLPDKYSIYIDNKPLVLDGTTYENETNPFGFVPFVYVPRFREGGGFYGSSIVDDIRGLVLEYNSRLADSGDALQEVVHRELFARDLNAVTDKIDLNKDGLQATNLGKTAPMSENQPEVFAIDPPSLSDALVNQPDKVREELMRQGSIGAVAYGEDEGSQRSGVTLEIRMWPLTSITRMQRTFLEIGFNLMATWIVKMCIIKNLFDDIAPDHGIVIEDVKRMLFSQDWASQIPRDHAQMVADVVQRLGTHSISLDEALIAFGVRDVEAEKERIYADVERMMSIEAKFAATTKTTSTSSPEGSGTTTESVTPDALSSEVK